MRLFRICLNWRTTELVMKCLEKLEDEFKSVQKEVEFANDRLRVLLESKKQHMAVLSRSARGADASCGAAKVLDEILESEVESAGVMVGFLQGPMMTLVSGLGEEISQGLDGFRTKIKLFESRDRELKALADGVASKDPVVKHYTVQGHLSRRCAHVRENIGLLEESLESGIRCINRVRSMLWMGIQRFSVHRRVALKSGCGRRKPFSGLGEGLNLQSFKSMLEDEMRGSPGDCVPGDVLYRESVEVQTGLSGWRRSLVVMLGQRLLFVEAGREQESIEDLLAKKRPMEYSVASIDVVGVNGQQVRIVLKHQGFFSVLLGFNSFGMKFPSSASLRRFTEALEMAGTKGNRAQEIPV